MMSTTALAPIDTDRIAVALQQRIVTIYNRASTWADHPTYEIRGAILDEARDISTFLLFLAQNTTGVDYGSSANGTILGVDTCNWLEFWVTLRECKRNYEYRYAMNQPDFPSLQDILVERYK